VNYIDGSNYGGLKKQSDSIISNISDVIGNLNDSCEYVNNDRMRLCNEALEKLKNAKGKIDKCLDTCLMRNNNLLSELRKTEDKISSLTSAIAGKEREIKEEYSIISSCRPPYYDEDGYRHDPDGAKLSAARDAINRLEHEISNLNYDRNNEAQKKETILKDIERTQRKIDACKECQRNIDLSKQRVENNKSALEDMISKMKSTIGKLQDIRSRVGSLTDSAMEKVYVVKDKINKALEYAENYFGVIKVNPASQVDADLDTMTKLAVKLKNFGTDIEDATVNFYKCTSIIDDWIDRNRDNVDEAVGSGIGQSRRIGEELFEEGKTLSEGVYILGRYLLLAN